MFLHLGSLLCLAWLCLPSGTVSTWLNPLPQVLGQVSSSKEAVPWPAYLILSPACPSPCNLLPLSFLKIVLTYYLNLTYYIIYLFIMFIVNYHSLPTLPKVLLKFTISQPPRTMPGMYNSIYNAYLLNWLNVPSYPIDTHFHHFVLSYHIE